MRICTWQPVVNIRKTTQVARRYIIIFRLQLTLLRDQKQANRKQTTVQMVYLNQNYLNVKVQYKKCISSGSSFSEYLYQFTWKQLVTRWIILLHWTVRYLPLCDEQYHRGSTNNPSPLQTEPEVHSAAASPCTGSRSWSRRFILQCSTACVAAFI